MKVKNIMITGGAGYIGSHVTETLINLKFKIFIIDNLSRGHRRLINKNAFFIKADTKNINALKKIINQNNIDIIIHLAGYANVAESQKKKKKYYNNNIIGTLNLLKACKNSKVKKFIFSSSCSVYGNTVKGVNERYKANPISYYAYTKYKCEELIKEYSKKYKFKYIILRYFNVAGASNSGKIGEIGNKDSRLIKNLSIQYFKPNPKINIYGNNYNTKDGTCVRDFVHVSDIANIHKKCVLNGKVSSNVFNCGYGKGYSVLEICKIFKQIKKNSKIIYCGRRSGDVSHIYADVNKFKKTFFWKPKYNNIKKILLSSIRWQKKLQN